MTLSFICSHLARDCMTDDDHDIWMGEAGKLLRVARRDAGTLESSLRQLCNRAFREFQFTPSVILDYMVVSSPGLFEVAGFSDEEINQLMPTIDRIVGEEWAAWLAR